MALMLRRVLIAAAAVLSVSGAARADLPEPAPPADAAAWWRFDPTPFAAARARADADGDGGPGAAGALVEPMLRAGVSAGLFGDGLAAQVIEGLLAASGVGRRPHTLVIRDLDASRTEDGTGVDVRDLSAWLAVDAPAPHEPLLRSVRAIALDAATAKGDARPEDFRQRLVTLPDGRRIAELRARGWESWRTLSWASEPGRFTVGLGAGVLAGRQETPADEEPGARPARPGLAAHRAAVDAARPEGELFLEAAVDIDRLRRAFPSAFAYGRTPRMLRALGLERASRAVLHGRLVDDPSAGRLVALDVTWSPRLRGAPDGGDDAGEIRRVALTEHAWASDAAPAPPLPPPPGSYVLLVRTPVAELFGRAMAVYTATVTDSDLPAFAASRERYAAGPGASLDRLLAMFAGSVVLSDYPTPPIAAPGVATIYVPLAPGADPESARAALAAALEPFAGVLAELRGGGTAFRLDEAGAVRFPVWSVIDRGGSGWLVGGWGEACINANRAWLVGATPGRHSHGDADAPESPGRD